jgi:hypothetical protein
MNAVDPPRRSPERNVTATVEGHMAWDELQNLRTADLQVREQLSDREKNWVVGQLVSRAGVNDARWRREKGLRIVVEYDADVINASELCGFLQNCGLHAKPAPLGRR